LFSALTAGDNNVVYGLLFDASLTVSAKCGFGAVQMAAGTANILVNIELVAAFLADQPLFATEVI
jgi:hypothetical protein